MINTSPVSDDVLFPAFSLEIISNTAPPMPNANPVAFKMVTFSFNIQKAKRVISNGVQSINNEAWMVEVIVNPLIKSIWLAATPVKPQSKKRGKCFFLIPIVVFPNSHIVQNNIKLIPTLRMLTPYGPTNDGEIYFTML